MTSNTYKSALRQAKKDLASKIRTRDSLNVEIGSLQQLVKSLSASIEGKPNPDEERERKKLSLSALVGVRFTDMVHSIVSSSETEMSAADVKKALESKGYDLSEYSNPSALIHQTLKRLAKDGRIQTTANGKYAMDPIDVIFGNFNRKLAKDRKK